MHGIADIIRLAPTVFGLVSVINNLLLVAGCILISQAMFRLKMRNPPVTLIFSAVLAAGVGAFRPFAAASSDENMMTVFSTLLLLLPFACMALVFYKKGLWKSMLVAAGYTFAESVKFLLLFLFFNYDNNARDEAVEMTVELFVDVFFFLCALAFYLLYAAKKENRLEVTRQGAALFLLVTATVLVFMVSLGLLSHDYTQSNQSAFVFMMLNIPLLTVTVTFGMSMILKARTTSEVYKAQLDMQVQHYEFMARMNDDLRMFRHDFPKKMRPLIAYLDDNNVKEARSIAEQFVDFMSNQGERIRTGNYRLDTVLFCEQQVAQRDGITINVPYGTVFPARGIAPDDLYTIFPNALDNAIEACRRVEGDRVIEFRTTLTEDTVYVTVRNPFAGALKLKNGVPQTEKADKQNHGYGLRNIRKAASHYGEDNVTCSAENGFFELRIVLQFDPGEDTGAPVP